MRQLLIPWLAWVACGVALLIFATNLWLLWALWLVALGILLGKALAREPRWPEMAGLSVSLLIFGVLLVRGLPIHSLGWGQCSRMTITELGQDWQIEVYDPGEIDGFKSFSKRGHYETMQKSGYGYHIYAGDGTNMTGYYVHGSCIGERPDGFVQTVFVPQKDGFRDFFEGVLRKHGHEKK
jgi:hypothetical protein